MCVGIHHRVFGRIVAWRQGRHAHECSVSYCGIHLQVGRWLWGQCTWTFCGLNFCKSAVDVESPGCWIRVFYHKCDACCGLKVTSARLDYTITYRFPKYMIVCVVYVMKNMYALIIALFCVEYCDQTLSYFLFYLLKSSKFCYSVYLWLLVELCIDVSWKVIQCLLQFAETDEGFSLKAM